MSQSCPFVGYILGVYDAFSDKTKRGVLIHFKTILEKEMRQNQKLVFCYKIFSSFLTLNGEIMVDQKTRSSLVKAGNL